MEYTPDFPHDLNNVLGSILLSAEMLQKKAGANSELLGYIETIMATCEKGARLIAGTRTPNAADTRSLGEIMVVDDDVQLLQMFGDIFSDEQIPCALFGHCQPAIEHFKKEHERISAVVLDMKMPDMNGIECLAIMRGINPRINIILLTGYGLSAEIKKIIDDRTVYIAKPVRSNTLLDTIRKLVFNNPAALAETGPVRPFSSAARVPNTAHAEILIVDDEQFLADLLREILQEKGHVCNVFNDPATCLQNLVGAKYKLGIIDFKLPGMDGVALIEKLRAHLPNIKTILLTGVLNDQELRHYAKKKHIDHVMKKPVDLNGLNAVVAETFTAKKKSLSEKGSNSRFADLMVGDSPAMQGVRGLISRLAKSDANLLVVGETGTGKELAAHAIHRESPRCNNAFIPVNCASLPDTLLESELFGYEKGAFTGALQTKRGLFEWADHGTLFLDEIGDLNYKLQAKLLRVIQERKIRRIGGKDELAVDVRIISATNKDLEKMIADNTFREDLYYRLNAVKIELPRLGDRTGDIPLLVEYFIKKFNTNQPVVPIKGVSADALAGLLAYPWPGNIRELENTLFEMFLLSSDGDITLAELPSKIKYKTKTSGPLDKFPALDDYLETAKREYITGLLEKYHGNIVQCAKHAGVNRASFHRILQNFKITPKNFRG